MGGVWWLIMELNKNERELLAEEAEALIEQVREPQRGKYVALREALKQSPFPDELAPTLESLLTLELRTGRARKMHGPMAESALVRLYGRTPTGTELSKNAGQVNKALAALEGQTIEQIAFTPKGPGAYSLELETSEYRVQLEIREEGIWVKEVGLDL